MPVRIAPASTPRMGLENIRKNFVKFGSLRSPETEPDSDSMPNISVAKPSRMRPVSFFLPLPVRYRMMPITASTGVNDDGFSSCRNRLSPLMPDSDSSHAVTVVPMFAPMITGIDCRRLRSPELTKPTTMTVVADDDWITAVTARPVSRPENRPLVSFARMAFSEPPARFSSAVPITLMPNRNRLSEPSMVKKSKIVISQRSLSVFLLCSDPTINLKCQKRVHARVKSS